MLEIPRIIGNHSDNLIAFCENSRHAKMIEHLLLDGKLTISGIFTLEPIHDLERFNVPIIDLRDQLSANGHPHAPKTVWSNLQSTSFDYFQNCDLVYFQDQSWPSQAISGAAASSMRRRFLIQDGYLSFDRKKALGWRKIFGSTLSRMDKLALKTTNPRFRLWKNWFIYNQHFFGISRPSMVFVYGEEMKHHLTRYFGIEPDRIHVSGPLISPNKLNDETSETLRVEPLSNDQPHEAPRILFLDQCFLQYNRMSLKNWRSNYLPMIRHLSQYRLTVKLHPSQTNEAIEQIKLAAGPNARFLDQGLLRKSQLNAVDLAVTVSSTAFLICVESGIPVIFHDAHALDLMPTIQHELICNTSSVAQLKAVIRQYNQHGSLPSNTKGEMLNYYVKQTF